MILALLLAAAGAQDAPPALDEPVEDEIVVRATYGRTTMLFDKGSDGKLRNCRIMVSSGSQRLDEEACEATPVCYAPTADEVTECVELTDVHSTLVPLPHLDTPTAPAGAATPTFEMPRLVRPSEPRPSGVAGPSEVAADREADRLRIEKLPPPPTAPSDLPAIRITNAQDQ